MYFCSLFCQFEAVSSFERKIFDRIPSLFLTFWYFQLLSSYISSFDFRIKIPKYTWDKTKDKISRKGIKNESNYLR